MVWIPCPFDQWYIDHADDLSLEDKSHELWDRAVSGDEDEDEEATLFDDEENEDEELKDLK